MIPPQSIVPARRLSLHPPVGDTRLPSPVPSPTGNRQVPEDLPGVGEEGKTKRVSPPPRGRGGCSSRGASPRRLAETLGGRWRGHMAAIMKCGI